MALYGFALATLDDDPGLRPDAHAFIVDKAPWFTVTDDLPQYPARIPGQNARSHAIAVRAATLSVCWSFGEGTFAGKHGNGRDAPLADRRPTRTHASKAPHFSAAARSTADCERLPDMRRAICRCSNRSR